MNPYGALPGEDWREYRYSRLGRALARAGHSVMWWTADFEHRSKRYRQGPRLRHVAPGFDITLVPTPRYDRHIGLGRVRFERAFARGVWTEAQAQAGPDVVILCDPALFTAGPIVDIVQSTGARLIADVVDLWPELFKIALPRALRGAHRLLFAPLYARRRWLYRQVDGLLAVAPSYLALAADQGAAIRPERRAVVYCGLDADEFERDAAGATEAMELVRGRPRSPGEVVAIYAGTLGENYDIRTVIAAAERLSVEEPRFSLVIAGAGPLTAFVTDRLRDRGLRNVTVAGWLDAKAVSKLMRASDIGISSYLDGSPIAMPVKAFDYFAAGVPIVNSLTGDLAHVIAEHGAGINYPAQDVNALVTALAALVRDAQVRRTMAARSRALATTFDAARQYSRAVDVVAAVAQG